VTKMKTSAARRRAPVAGAVSVTGAGDGSEKIEV